MKNYYVAFYSAKDKDKNSLKILTTTEPEEAVVQYSRAFEETSIVQQGLLEIPEGEEPQETVRKYLHDPKMAQTLIHLSTGIINACPKCGCQKLKIDATEYICAYISFDNKGNHEVYDTKNGDIEWEDENYTECTNCQDSGPLREFIIPNPEIACPVNLTRLQNLNNQHNLQLTDQQLKEILNRQPIENGFFTASSNNLITEMQNL